MQFLVFEQKILNRLITDSMSVKEQAKLKFGFYIVLDTIKKSLFVYIIAFILGITWEVFIVHTSFLFIRQVTYGWHSLTNKGCIVDSILVFVGLPYLISYVSMSPLIINITGLLILGSIYMVGPVGTHKNPVSSVKRQFLKRKLLIRLCVLLVISYFISTDVFQYIIVGSFIQFIALGIQIIKNGGVYVD